MQVIKRSMRLVWKALRLGLYSTAPGSLLVLLVLAAAVFTYVTFRDEGDTKHAERQTEIFQLSSCIGGSQRTIEQLQFDWVVYEADEQTATSSSTPPSQQKIRGQEADRLLLEMERIASHRIDVYVAYHPVDRLPDGKPDYLSQQLLAVVRQAGFHCS